MSEHLRRAIALRLAIAALALTLPAAAAIGWLRAAARRARRRGPAVPGLNPDGKPLEDWERVAFLDITRAERSRA